jgi:glycosyltransferase involved in cell wall biosynthesis
MRILHLLSTPFWSGPAENVALLAVAQRALGHQATVAVDRKRTQVASEEPIVPRLRELGVLDEGGLELSVKSSPLAMARDVASLRRRRDVEVIHSHFTHDHLVAALGKPRRAGLFRSIHAPRSIRRTLPRADAYTVPGEEDLLLLRRRPAVVLPPLLSPLFRPPEDRDAVRRELGLQGQPLIGMVSTFQESRRHDLALEAFERVLDRRPAARLVLVGDGVLEQEIRQRVQREELDAAVTFAGYQQGERFVRWLQAFDEIWVLGQGNDFSGRAALQARACGVRVIAAQQGGLPRYADVVLRQLTAGTIADASLGGERREVPLPSNQQIAEAVVALYRSARAGT